MCSGYLSFSMNRRLTSARLPDFQNVIIKEQERTVGLGTGWVGQSLFYAVIGKEKYQRPNALASHK